jgi:hypothetical protein
MAATLWSMSAGVGVSVYDFRFGVRGLLNGFGEVENECLGVGSDVVRLADGVGRGGAEVGLDDVVDVDEIASLRAVAVDGDRLAVPGQVEEDEMTSGRSTEAALFLRSRCRWWPWNPGDQTLKN